jgi:putative membrane protein
MSATLSAVLADHWHHGGGWFPWFPLVPLFFAGLWVFLLVFVLPRRWRGNGGPSADEVLAERYARGEIDEREFRERRAVLRGKG